MQEGIEMDKKSEVKRLSDELLYKNKNGIFDMSEQDFRKCDKFCESYKKFLDASKTEREAVFYAVHAAEEKGFRPYKPGEKLSAGDKIYVNNRGKAIILCVIGSEPLSEGIRICAAHIDSPRLDIKQNPLYDDAGLGLLKTHYYGGIKKYQWSAIPLALHGVMYKADGTRVDVCIGEKEGDPVFCVTDLLPHLAQEQMKRTLAQGLKGEELNVLVGSYPFKEDKESENVRLALVKLLSDSYGIKEEDFLSAELEAVPAFKAADIGFDRSMVGGYGQDDRVCAFPALQAILSFKNPEKTALTILADKEEVGSEGNTGLNSSYMRYFIEDISESLGENPRRVISASSCLSADVNAAFDPTFPQVCEKKNSSYINHGVCVMKFTGSRGKSGASDASAEYVSEIRRLFNKNKIAWQMAELGAVDEGGGGTVAAYIANLDIDTIDVGVPVLSMHSPFEVTAKHDIYMAYKAFKAFME